MALPNKPTPFQPQSSNKADPPKTPSSKSQSHSSSKADPLKTPTIGSFKSSVKKMGQKGTSKLVQLNLMNMFNKVAHTAASMAIKDSKTKMINDDPKDPPHPKQDETENEPLPRLLHNDSESEEETPMKPPADSKDHAPDPDDDWDCYTEDVAMKGAQKKAKKHKQRKMESSKKRTKMKQAKEEQEGWLDLEIDEDDLEIDEDCCCTRITSDV